MPKGYPNNGTRKPRSRKKIIPGQAALKRLWIGGHYKNKGLSLEQLEYFSSLDCFYCGEPPKRTNPFCETYEKYVKVLCKTTGPCSEGWWQDQWIYFNGIDKIKPTDRYDDLFNLVTCCHICNFMKQRLDKDEFILYCNKIANRHPICN